MPVVTLSGSALGSFVVEPGQPLTLGRALDADVPIDDLRISRRHCTLEVTEHGLVATDLQSANGTFLNGKRIKRAVVRPGDKLQIGDAVVRVDVDFKGADVLDREHGCADCKRGISLATFADGDVIQLDRGGFLCPQCRERRERPALSLAERSLVQRLRGEGYEVQGKLSLVGHIPIFKARRAGIDQVVAIKALLLSGSTGPKKIARFIQEAKAEARLRHPNIVTIHDVRQADDLLCIVMELIEGQTLHDEIERAGRMATKDALRIGYQIAKALAHAHERGIIHRDVKPHNIMITPQGDAKLIDFGLAKNVWAATAGAITREGETLGTLGYMAPEQARSANRADHRADIYGLGATLYHCLSGRPPFVADSSMDLARAIENLEPPPLTTLEGLPPNVIALVGRMMRKRPDERFQRPHDVIAAIETLVAEMAGLGDVRGNAEFFLRLRDERVDLTRTMRQNALPPQPAGPAPQLGAFRDRELEDFLRGLEAGRRTGTVEVAGGPWRGKIRIRAGRIVGAETWPRTLGKGLSGETEPIRTGEVAVLALLALPRGDVEFTPGPEGIVPECDLEVSRILALASRRRVT